MMVVNDENVNISLFKYKDSMDPILNYDLL